MLDIILENLIKILTALVLTLISVGGTWLTVQLPSPPPLRTSLTPPC